MTDVLTYLKTLAEIKADYGHTLDTWPPQSEIYALFIYAANPIRYISQGDVLYKSRLSALGNQDKVKPIRHR